MKKSDQPTIKARREWNNVHKGLRYIFRQKKRVYTSKSALKELLKHALYREGK